MEEKTMKKLLALLLCLLLVCSAFVLASCDATDKADDDKNESSNSDTSSDKKDDSSKEPSTLNGKTAEELYALALEKVAGLTNFEMTATQVIEMTYEGDTITMNQIVINKMNGQDCYMKMENDMSPDANMEMWYVDEWMYVITEGVQNKANITWEEMQETYMPEGATAEGALMNIPEAWFKDVKFEQEGDAYYLEFIVSGEEYLTYMDSTSLGAYLEGVDDVSYKVYFDKDGNLGQIVTEFDFVIETISCHAVSTSTVTNIGSVTIEAPEGTFADVTDQM